MEPSIKYSLPPSLRDELRKPFGMLLTGKEFNQQVLSFKNIISIGDYLSCSLLEKGIFPQIMIIDYQTKRKSINAEQKHLLNTGKYKIIQVENPAGVITHSLWDTIQSACESFSSDQFIQIQVDGEEDLAALPAILYAPANVTIIYGMPDKGVVVAQSTDYLKQKVSNILTKM
jgi:GTP-dependent dephospho-CoA kinase